MEVIGFRLCPLVEFLFPHLGGQVHSYIVHQDDDEQEGQGQHTGEDNDDGHCTVRGTCNETMMIKSF